MIPNKTIEDLISKHAMLEKELSAGQVDKKLFAEKSKEYSDLNEIIDDAKNIYFMTMIKLIQKKYWMTKVVTMNLKLWQKMSYQNSNKNMKKLEKD